MPRASFRRTPIGTAAAGKKLEMMSPNRSHNALSIRKKVIARLREVISALDRRQPQIERAGERHIANDSAILKKQAQERIAELESCATSDVVAP